MPLIVTERSAAWLVRSYAPGVLQLARAERIEEARSPLLLAPDSGVTALASSSPETLVESDLSAVLTLAPEVVLLGTASGSPLGHGTAKRRLLERGIGLELMTLGAACRTYNLLVQDGRRVVALLFP